jgi:hypothetical protein
MIEGDVAVIKPMSRQGTGERSKKRTLLPLLAPPTFLKSSGAWVQKNSHPSFPKDLHTSPFV